MNQNDMLCAYLQHELLGQTHEQIAKRLDVDESTLSNWLEENKMQVSRALPKIAKEMIRNYQNEIKELSNEIKSVLDSIENDKTIEKEMKVKHDHQEKEIAQLTKALLQQNEKNKIDELHMLLNA